LERIGALAAAASRRAGLADFARRDFRGRLVDFRDLRFAIAPRSFFGSGRLIKAQFRGKRRTMDGPMVRCYKDALSAEK
jgi:hypothetical protein